MAHEERQTPLDPPSGRPPHPALRRVCERFPALQDHVASRFASDETFRELCEDYDVCAATLARLHTRYPEPNGMLDEYAALLLRLERELLRYLEEHGRFRES